MVRLRAPLPCALLCLLLVAPLALAQNDTTPSPNPQHTVPGTEESVEDEEGISYGIAILVGTIAVAGVLAYVMRKQPPRP